MLHMPSLTYHASKPVSQREYHAHFSEKEVKSEREEKLLMEDHTHVK